MKKLISMALSVVLALSLMPSAFAAERASEFTDVPEGAWYAEELDYAVYNGYISGTSDTTFSPESTVTRGQFVTIMGRMLNAPTDGGKTAFEDVPENAFYAPYVAWASSKGYVNGFSTTQFGPNNNISVEQMAAILDNYIRKEGTVLTEAPVVYTDMASVSRWAVSAVEAMARYNLLHVDASGNVTPQKQVSRAEAAVALVRLAKALNLGVVPPAEQTTITGQKPAIDPFYGDGWDDLSSEERAALIEAYTAASEAEIKRIHDELWASGAIKEGMSEKEKAIAYFRWMFINCKYGDGTSYGYPEYQSHDAYGALVNRVAVCEGLANGYKALLDYEGIACECYAVPGRDHMYNIVTLDGEQYTVDVSGSGGRLNPDGSVNEKVYEIIRDKYFYPDKYAEDFKPLEW